MRLAALSNPSARVREQPTPTQSDFAMPGRNTPLSNKINPTKSTNAESLYGSWPRQ